jgi:hypothetical protein
MEIKHVNSNAFSETGMTVEKLHVLLALNLTDVGLINFAVCRITPCILRQASRV